MKKTIFFALNVNRVYHERVKSMHEIGRSAPDI